MTLEEYRKVLEYHDWSYEYSDDGAAYRRGAANLARLVAIAKGNGEDYRRAFAAAEARRAPDKTPTFTFKES